MKILTCPKEFAAFVKSERERKGLTQDAVAAKAQMSVPSLERWEAGTNLPTLDVQQRWLNALGYDVNYNVTQINP